METALCPLCGAPLNEASICPNCGYRMQAQPVPPAPQYGAPAPQNAPNIVTVHGYTETFLATPDVKVFCNGMPVGRVPAKGTLSVEIQGNCQLTFKCNLRSASVNVVAGQTSDIFLSFDRFSGKMKAVPATAGMANAAIQSVNESGKSANIKSIALIGGLFLFCLILKTCGN